MDSRDSPARWVCTERAQEAEERCCHVPGGTHKTVGLGQRVFRSFPSVPEDLGSKQNGPNLPGSQDHSYLPYHSSQICETKETTRSDFWGSLLITCLPSRKGRGKGRQFLFSDSSFSPWTRGSLLAIPAPLASCTPFSAHLPQSLCYNPSSSACSVLPHAATALGSSGASYPRKAMWTALPHGRHICIEAITALSLNNPLHNEGELFSSNTFCVYVPKDLDIKQLELLWMSGMSSDPDLDKEGRTLPSMLTWWVIGSSPYCSLGYSWLLHGCFFQLFMKDLTALYTWYFLLFLTKLVLYSN